MNILKSCKICPHECKVNRLKGKVGRCRSTNKIKIALASLHQYEEPCISGYNGSGTIFSQIAIWVVNTVRIMKLAK